MRLTQRSWACLQIGTADDSASAANCGTTSRSYRAGLRCGEALAVLPKDVNFDWGTIAVLRAKSGRSRTIGNWWCRHSR